MPLAFPAILLVLLCFEFARTADATRFERKRTKVGVRVRLLVLISAYEGRQRAPVKGQ